MYYFTETINQLQSRPVHSKGRMIISQDKVEAAHVTFLTGVKQCGNLAKLIF
jgi:hypothetical protein